MTTTPPASLADLVLGLELGPTAQDAINRCSLEGLTVGPARDGALAIAIQRLEAASLRLAFGPFTLEVGRIALHQVTGQVRVEDGRPRLGGLEAASAELTGAKVYGPLELSLTSAPAADAWCLGPLAAAEGTIRAEIVDAHLLFDADVTVPIRQGQIELGDATVEHVGPDSRMGVSRMGLYVDAPNGRSYLFQFASTPVAGVEYEQRGTLLGPWVRDRGKLRLQEFGEWLLRHAGDGKRLALTEQARQLFDRTAVSGQVQLSDGRFAAPGVEASLVGRAEGRNAVKVHSEAVGRGLSIELASLSVRDAVLNAKDAQLRCDEVAAGLMLRVSIEGTQMRFAFELPSVKLSGLHLRLHGPGA